jgi:hypothetical protein
VGRQAKLEGGLAGIADKEMHLKVSFNACNAIVLLRGIYTCRTFGFMVRDEALAWFSMCPRASGL